MKVVLDATGLDTGHRTRGIGRYVQGLVQGFVALHEAGELTHEVSLLRHAGRTPHPDDAALPFEAVEYPRKVLRAASWMHVENRLRLKSFLPDDTALYHATGMEGFVSGLPWVATCHDLIPVILKGRYLEPWAVKERAFWKEYMRALRDCASHVVAISEHTRRSLVDVAGVPEEKISVVHHGLSPFWFEPADVPEVTDRIRREVAAGPYVLFVGGFDPRKQFKRLTQAMAMIPDEMRPRLLIAGVRSNPNKIEHRLLKDLPKIEHTFLEFVSDADLRFLYNRSVCLAFPSLEEGWGFPIVEAMAAGTPVICAPFGSMVEAAGGAAVTVNVRRAEDIGHGIRLCLESESIRSKHVEAGRERARQLTWTQTARGVLNAWDRGA